MGYQDAMITVLRHAGRCQSTQDRYCAEFRRFLDWVGTEFPMRIERSDVLGYLDEVGKTTPFGRRLAHASLRFFYVNTVNRPELVEGIPWPRQVPSLRQAPPWSDVVKLLQAVEDPVSHAATSVIAGAGLRVSEVCELQVSDIQTHRDHQGRALDSGVIVVRHGKGNKGRLAPLTPTLVQTLRTYYREVRPQEDLFTELKLGKRLTPRRLRKRLKEAAQQCGVVHYRPHELRHAFATTMLEQGVDLKTLQTALGHKRLTSTSVYLHIRRDRLSAMPDLLSI